MGTLIDQSRRENLLEQFKQAHYALCAEKAQAEKELARVRQRKKALEERKVAVGKALALVQKVAIDTQKQIESRIDSLVSFALSAVWEREAYQFELRFGVKRGQTEAEMYFVRDGKLRISPMESSGGGVKDVASFVLRVGYLSLLFKKFGVRKFLLLDEPFKYVSPDLQNRCALMMKELSQKVGLQILMISHLPEIYSIFDTVYRVSQRARISVVERRSVSFTERPLPQQQGNTATVKRSKPKRVKRG